LSNGLKMQNLKVDPSTLLIGLDGCKNGWIGAASELGDLTNVRLIKIRSFDDLFGAFGASPGVVAVDMPVGLVNDGSRAVEGAARKILGSQASSIFTPPERILLEFASLNGHLESPYPSSYDDSYNVVNDWAGNFLDHGVQRQAFGIYGKIAEIDRYMTAERDPRVHEAHPELIFREMNNGDQLPPKRQAEGVESRTALLADKMGVDAGLLSVGGDDSVKSNRDDELDALALLWTAKRIATGEARRIPEVVDFDPVGLDMAMWF
jgi:predicted RNase H-like nuclease